MNDTLPRAVSNARRRTAHCCLAALVVLIVGIPAQAETRHAFPIFGLQFSPDGKLLAAASNSITPPGPIAIWNVKDWTVHQVFHPAKGSLDLDFSPDGTQLAFGTQAGIVGILDVASGNLAREIHAHSNTVFSIAYLPDGKSLVSASADRSIKMWNLSTGDLIRRFDGHTDTVDGIAVSPDGRTLLSGGNDRVARLWDIGTGEIKSTSDPFDSIVRRVAFSRDGAFALISSWGGVVRIQEARTGQLRARLSSGSHCADITADNRLVATSGHGSTAEVFAVNLRNPSSDERLWIANLIESFQDENYAVRDSAANEIVRIGTVAEPQLREAMTHEDAEVRSRARRLREKVLSPEPVKKLGGHRGDVEVVCFSPDGQLIASACRGGDIKVWDTSSNAEVVTLTVPSSSNAK